MLGRSNTNVTVNGPTLNLNGEIFAESNSSLKPLFTINNTSTEEYVQPNTLPGTLTYHMIRLKNVNTTSSSAFTIDFAPVKWKYKAVTLVCMDSDSGNGGVTRKIELRINDTVAHSMINTSYHVGTPDLPWYQVTLPDLDDTTIIDGTIAITNGNSNPRCEFNMLFAVGYLR